MGFVAFVFLLACVNAVAFDHRQLSILGLAVELFYVGFTGTQRIWYLRRLRAQRFATSEVWSLTRAFFGRYFRLGILCAIPITVILVAWSISYASSHPHGNAGENLPFGIILLALAVTVIIDITMTFVVPALAFRTDSAMDGLRFGLRMLRQTWPTSLWYALAPGIAISFSSLLVSTHALNGWGRPILWVISGMVAFALRGTIVPFYIRRYPEVGSDGAAAVPTKSHP